MLVEQWVDFGAAKKGPAAYFLQAHDPEKARGRPRPIGVAKVAMTSHQALLLDKWPLCRPGRSAVASTSCRRCGWHDATVHIRENELGDIQAVLPNNATIEDLLDVLFLHFITAKSQD